MRCIFHRDSSMKLYSSRRYSLLTTSELYHRMCVNPTSYSGRRGSGPMGHMSSSVPGFTLSSARNIVIKSCQKYRKKCRQSAELWNGRVSVQIGGYFCGAGVQTTNRVIMWYDDSVVVVVWHFFVVVVVVVVVDAVLVVSCWSEVLNFVVVLCEFRWVSREQWVVYEFMSLLSCPCYFNGVLMSLISRHLVWPHPGRRSRGSLRGGALSPPLLEVGC